MNECSEFFNLPWKLYEIIMNKLLFASLSGLISIISIMAFNYTPDNRPQVCLTVGCCEVEVKLCEPDCANSCCTA